MKRYLHFLASGARLETLQKERLHAVLESCVHTARGEKLGLDVDMSYEDYRTAVPVAEYEDLAPWIERQRSGESHALSHEAFQYQPTSGSTGPRKWIPVNRAFQQELDVALEVWLCDLLRRYPKAFTGRHYWSLSWLPNDLRAARGTTDDLKLLPPLRRWIMRQVMAVPSDVADAETVEECLFATALFLVLCPRLTLTSVWSPTFLLTLLDFMESERPALARAARQGGTLRLGKRSAEYAANGAVADILEARSEGLAFERLWPDLALVSAWDGAAAAPWAARLRSRLPKPTFQAKGLWMTEGVVTIPLADRHVLAANAHFYEFKVLPQGNIIPSWKLVPGQRVQPVLSTGAGFLRYLTRDILEVCEPYEGLPVLKFLGRAGGCDLTGEKLTPEFVETCLARLPASPALLTLYGVNTPPRPYYLALFSGDASTSDTNTLATQLETCLQGSHHYRLSRELGQLGPVRVLVRPDALNFYMSHATRAGLVLGDVKPERVTLWRSPEPPPVSGV